MQMRLKSGDKAGFQDFSQIGWTDPVFCDEIKLNPGKTWVLIVLDNYTDETEIR